MKKLMPSRLPLVLAFLTLMLFVNHQSMAQSGLTVQDAIVIDALPFTKTNFSSKGGQDASDRRLGSGSVVSVQVPSPASDRPVIWFKLPRTLVPLMAEYKTMEESFGAVEGFYQSMLTELDNPGFVEMYFFAADSNARGEFRYDAYATPSGATDQIQKGEWWEYNRLGRDVDNISDIVGVSAFVNGNLNIAADHPAGDRSKNVYTEGLHDQKWYHRTFTDIYIAVSTYNSTTDTEDFVDFNLVWNPACPINAICTVVDIDVTDDVRYARPGGFGFYLEAGTYLDTLVASDGRDSLITTNLTFSNNKKEVDLFMDETLCPTTDELTRVPTTDYVPYGSFPRVSETRGDFVEINSVSDDIAGKNRSIFAWIKPDGKVPSSTNYEIVSINGATGNSNRSLFSINSSEKIRVFDGSSNHVTTTTVTDGNWHFVGYTYDNSTFETKIYVDGVLENTFTNSQPVIASDRISIGQEYDGTSSYSDFYKGLITEVTVWDEILTQDDIDKLKIKSADATHPKATNLVGKYSFAKVAGADNSVIKDLSGKGNDGNGFRKPSGSLASTSDIPQTAGTEQIPGYDAAITFQKRWSVDNNDISTADSLSESPFTAGDYDFLLFQDGFQITDEFTITNDASCVASSATITIADISGKEDDGSITVTLTLDTEVVGGLTAKVASENGTAGAFPGTTPQSEWDYSPLDVEVTFVGTAGETQTVTFIPLSDTNIEPDETVTIKVTEVTGTTASITHTDTGTITIQNDDAAEVRITAVTGNEGDGTITVTAILNNDITGGFTLDASTEDASGSTAATAGADYTAVANQTLTFAGTKRESQTFTVNITDDGTSESGEIFNVNLTNLQGTGLLVDYFTVGVVTIEDNDIPRLEVNTRAANEDDGPVTFTITLDLAVAGGFTVDVRTVDQTAKTSDSDYTALAGETVTFSGTAGETQTFDIAVMADDKLENSETLGIVMSNIAGTAATIDVSDQGGLVILNDDNAAITIADVSVNENNGDITMTATLDRQVQGGFTVDVNTVDGTASLADGDFMALSQTLTFAGTAGETQAFTVSPTNDNKVEGSEQFTVAMSGLSNTALTVDISDTAEITLTNDDSAKITISDVSVNEDDGTVAVYLLQDNPTTEVFTLRIESQNGTATSTSGDYSPYGATLSFGGSQLTERLEIILNVTPDDNVESDETFTLNLSSTNNPQSIDLSDVGIITIKNDDTPTVTIADASGEENAGAITLTATLNSAVAGGFSVDVATADLTAKTSDSDYTAIAGQTLAFTGNAGETQTFTVTPTGDATVEGDEELIVSMSNLSGAAVTVDISDKATVRIIEDEVPNVTIADVSGNEDDGAITVTAVLDGAVSGGFTLYYLVTEGSANVTFDTDYTGTAESDFRSVTFTGTAGESQSFQLTPAADTKFEIDETVILLPQVENGEVNLPDQVTVTITNDDAASLTIADVSQAENGGDITVSVVLDNAAETFFSVNADLTDGTATLADNDYSAGLVKLDFTGVAGETKTFTFTPTDDSKVEGDETLTVSLSNLVFSGEKLAIDITDQAIVTITNDDTATVTIADALGTENGGAITMTATLDKEIEAGFSVDVNSADGTATAGADYTAIASQTLNFTGTVGETQTFTISPIDDGVVEQNETVTLSMNNLSLSRNITITDQATLTIIDDEVPIVSIADVSANEDDGNITVTLSLDATVSGGFDVDVSTADLTGTAGADYTAVTAQTISFTGNAGETQTFTVTPTADAIVEPDETLQVSMSNLTGTATTIDISDKAVVTITNDDNATVTISPSSEQESSGTIRVIATLGAQVDGGFNFEAFTQNGTATGGTDYVSFTAQQVFFTGVAGETKEIIFNVLDDQNLEADETAVIKMQNLAGTTASVDISGQGVVTILNDDTPKVTITNFETTEDGGAVTVTAKLNVGVPGGFSVDVSTEDGTATTADYTAIAGQTLSFAGTVGEEKTFTFTPTTDANVEEDENVKMTLTNLVGTTQTIDISNETTVTILDDDVPNVTITDVSGSEDDGAITVTLEVDGIAGAAFTVDVSTSDQSATVAGGDYTAIVGQTINFVGTSANEQQTFTITPTSDAVVEPNETLRVSMTNNTGATVDFSDKAIVTINNDDNASLTVADVAGNEDDGSITVTVTLNGGIQGGFSVDAISTNGTATLADNDYTELTAETITFVGTTGETQTFTISPIEDSKAEPDETIGLSLTNFINNSLPVDISGQAIATITDDDTVPFITTWQTTTASESITIPTSFQSTYDFTVDWGDGSTDMNQTGDATHNYANAGTYTVSIKGLFPWMDGDNSSEDNMSKLMTVEQWGNNPWTSMENAFRNATSLTLNAADKPDLSGVTSLNGMFNGAQSMNQDINDWDVSNIIDMTSLFNDATIFNQALNNWDVSSVTTMRSMFSRASSFNQALNNWNVSAVTRMNNMFDQASSFNQALDNWDVSSVTSTNSMFDKANSFNQDLSAWDMSSVVDLSFMFEDNTAFNGNVSGWNLTSANNFKSMFDNATIFNQDLSTWIFSQKVDMEKMFRDAISFNQDLSSWDVSEVTNMRSVFQRATAFDQSLASWNMSKVSDLADMLDESGLSVANYDKTLISWASQTLSSNETLGSSGLEYCAGAMARQSIIDTYSWTIDGDSQSCTSTVTIADVSANEDDGDITVTLTSDAFVVGGFTVDVSTADGTATAGTDYTAVTAQTITFAGTVGETETFIISPTADSDDEANETVAVSMSNVVTAGTNTVTITDQATVTILNEDVATTFFTTIWKTTSDNEQILIPTEGGGYDYRIDWGDGTIEKNQDGDDTHTYATAGEYTVKIAGSFPRIVNSINDNNAAKLLSIEQWGTVEWLSMEGAFQGAINMVLNTPLAPDLSLTTSLQNMFNGAEGLTNEDLSAWDVSTITDMQGLFADASAFTGNVSSWNVGEVITMEKMFDNATVFNGDITGWDVSKVTDMSNLFDDAKAFNQNINGWDVSSVTEMNSMFNDADAFNQDLNNWDVSKVETFQAMFQNNDIFNSDISNWDISSATKLERMFEDAHAFNQDISTWQPTNANNLTAMFRDARAFNQDIDAWRFPNADRLNQMFYEAAAFDQDISSWETGNIVDMSSMFENAEAFNQNLSSWDVSAVKSFGSMFRGTLAFNQDISNWDMSATTSMSSMFKNAAVFNQDISSWTFSDDLTSMSSVFENATAFNQDLSSWDISKITGMSSLFNNSGLSIANYDATLIGWAAQSVQDNVELGVEGLQYCAGSAARQSLIDDHNWTIENDTQNCTATVTIADVSASEDDGDITVTLTSDAFVVGGFTVDVSTADGTATAGTDYTAVSAQTITFAGTTDETQTFTITPSADLDLEGDETIIVSMDNLAVSANNTVTIADQATVTITNDDAAAFITKWETTRANQQVTVPTEGAGYDYSIDWGDGTIENNQNGDATHTYSTAGEYTVKIAGSFPRIYVNGQSNNSPIKTIEEWGSNPWESMEGAFKGLTEISINATDAPDLSNVTSMMEMFADTDIGAPDFSGWDVSNIENMSGLFMASDFNGNITSWNVGALVNMSSMFEEATAFNQDISSWNVSKVTDMSKAFASAEVFNQNLNSWNVSSVTSMEKMFLNATVFNGDITSWNVSNVTTLRSTFQNADAFNQNISGWNVGNVTSMIATFSSTALFNQPLNDWDMSGVTSIEQMFSSTEVFNQDLNSWDVSNVESFDETFKSTKAFNGNISSWVVSSGEDFTGMFERSEAFNGAIGGWDLSSTTEMKYMFRGAVVFNQPINDWRFPLVTDIAEVFDGTGAFNQDLSDWEVGNITRLSQLFENAQAFNGDVSGWDVSNVTKFDWVFNNTPFNGDISSWDVSKGTTFSSMFRDASAFDQDLSSWDISQATNLSSMFNNSKLSITNYDAILNSWAIQDVQNDLELGVEGLFYCAGSAARQSLIDDHNWTIENDGQSCTTTVTIADVSGNEDDGDITVTLTSSGFVVDGFSLAVNTADGTALAGTDYTAVTDRNITFAGTVGETQTFTISPIADSEVEGDETLTVSMSDPIVNSGNVAAESVTEIINTDQATVTILDDDQAVVAFASLTDSGEESGTSASIEVTLDQPSLVSGTVNYAVSGTATGSGTDYTLASGTLTFAAGDVSETISLIVINDELVEADETVIITLSNPSDLSLGTNTAFTYTIEDEDEAMVNLFAVTSGEGDGPITLTATLDKAVDGGFTVDLVTAESSAIKGVDYSGLEDVTLTFAGTAGETQTTIITPVDDDIIEFDESISVLFDNLAGTSLNVQTGDVVEVTIEDNDQATVTIADLTQFEDGESFLLTATLDKAVVGGFTVDLSTTDGTATTADGDYTALVSQTLTFAGTAGETQTFEVNPGADSKLETNEIFTVAMSNLAGTTLPVIITDQATMTITNDDAAAVTIADASGNEGAGDITVTATLDNPVVGGFTVTVSTADGTATIADSDYTAVASQTLTFTGTAGETQTFTITPTNDLVIENDETLTVTMSDLSTSLGVDISDGATITLVNDDFNNAPSDIILGVTSIAENNALDATIGSLSTTDLDAGNTHTYSLVAGTGDTDNATFIIDGADMKVNNTSFNFEDRTNYSIRIQTDDGNGGTLTKVFTISISDVNEAPFMISLSNLIVAESDEAQDVGQLMTLDPDNGDTFTYEFVSGEQDAHNAEFQIVGSTVRTAGALNFEDGASRDFRVRVTDSGGLMFEWPFSIIIEDVPVEPVRDYTTNAPGADVKNVFSPNGDGVNETWVIEDLLDNPINEVKVFAQGGKLIYNKVNYRNDWGGTFRDDPVPDGTYYYEIVIFENAQASTPARVIKGFLTIIRNR